MSAKAHVTCQQLIDFLMSYLDNELPAGQRAEFDRHMAACPSCVDYVKTYEKTVSLARTVSNRLAKDSREARVRTAAKGRVAAIVPPTARALDNSHAADCRRGIRTYPPFRSAASKMAAARSRARLRRSASASAIWRTA